MEEPLIERTEIVALLFNVSDIASSLARIERLLANAQRTRELAERAQAKLDAKTSQQ
jgi:hypothetical protein